MTPPGAGMAEPCKKNRVGNSFKTSKGIRVSKSQIDTLVNKAKAEKIQSILDNPDPKEAYVRCEDCGQNDCVPVDCSHNISVDMCQKLGISEYAWAQENIKMRGRTCHKKYDEKPNRELIEKVLKKLKPL